MTFPISSCPCRQIQSLMDGSDAGASDACAAAAPLQPASGDVIAGRVLHRSRKKIVDELFQCVRQVRPWPGESADDTRRRAASAWNRACFAAAAVEHSVPLLQRLPAGVLNPLLIREQALEFGIEAAVRAAPTDAPTLLAVALDIWHTYLRVLKADNAAAWSHALDALDAARDRLERLAERPSNP